MKYPHSRCHPCQNCACHRAAYQEYARNSFEQSFSTHLALAQTKEASACRHKFIAVDTFGACVVSAAPRRLQTPLASLASLCKQSCACIALKSALWAAQSAIFTSYLHRAGASGRLPVVIGSSFPQGQVEHGVELESLWIAKGA